MAILSNIGAALFFIAFILLILCIISFFKKNGKATQYGRPTVILFYDFDYIDGNWLNKFRTSSHRIFYYFKFHFIYFLPCTSNLICN